MSKHRLTVVVSQAQGKNPTKRSLEESLAAALIMESGLEVSVVPHLYDLHPDHTGRLYLSSVSGDVVILSWLYPRATYWLLDRIGVKGHMGETQLKADDEDFDEEEMEGEEQRESEAIGAVDVPDRQIYCLDLRDFSNHPPYVEEIRRIATESKNRHLAAKALKQQENLIQLNVSLPESNGKTFTEEDLLQQPEKRRWYPVIDYSRCTNCMECLDFCLFGVYNVDNLDRILVENQDECKKGCPACSRVCPEQAIIFPEYKSPAIAGKAGGEVGGLKIDLTKLFGGGDAISIAAQERDRELVADGRDAVGLTVGIPKRQENCGNQPKDELDDLMDALDDLDI